MISDNKPLVVVLSRNYSTGLSVIRSLGSVGYTVDLVASANKEGQSADIASSKYVNNAVEVLSKKVKDGGDEQLVAELVKYKGRYENKPVLFPTDDYTTSIMDLNRSVLDEIFIMPGISGGKTGTLKYHMDKSVQSKIAEKAGILVPKEWVISLREDEIAIPADMVYPCFCKPLESSLGYKQEMAKCVDRDELLTHLKKLRDNYSNRSILVQEFLNIDEEIDLEGVCLDQKIILPGIIWKRLIAQYDKGVPLAGKTFDIEKLGETKEKVINMLKEFHYYGMFDLGLNIIGNKIYFNELNMRSGGTNFVYFMSGVNLPEIFIKSVTGQNCSTEEFKIKEFGKTYLYEKVAWDDYFHGFMTREALDECTDTSDIKIMCNDGDPAPGDLFMHKIKERIKRRERREEYIADIVSHTGWEYEYAVQQLSDARKRLEINAKDYVRYEFWKYTPDEQKREYDKILERRQKNREQKELCIISAMLATGWEREYAEEQIKDARRRLNIEYTDYIKSGLWKYIPEEQAYKYIAWRKAKQRYNNYDKPLVVVLSRNYSTGLSVIRSLGSVGYTVDLVASAYKPGRSVIASSSKYVRKSVEVVSKKVKDGGDSALIMELLKYAGECVNKPVLFPTDDYTAAIMDLNRNVLEPHFVMPEIVGKGQGAMTEYMDKTVQGEMAQNAGLPTPKEWIISLREEISIPDDMVYPCFCKPVESITGYKKEMAKCEDEVSLENHLNKLKRKYDNRSILVQEFLEIDNEIDLSGVCFDQKIIIPAIIKKTNVAQYEKGVTLAGKVVPFEEIGDIQQNVIEMLKSFHYNGMFDMEFNVVGDKLYFNEVNLRSGGPNYSYFMSGVNLPALFVKGILNKPYESSEEAVESYGKSFIYEKVAWEDHIKGFMTKRELKKCIADADIKLLCNDDDPEPGKLFMKKIKKSAYKSYLRKAKRKVGNFVKPVLRPLKYAVLNYPQTKKKNQRDPESKSPRIIVSGRNYCSNLSMARSLGEAGYEVEVLRIFQVKPKRRNLIKILKPDAYSKYIKAYHVCVSRRRSRRIVKRLIRLADPNRKQLLIPADDLVAYIADQYYDTLSEYYLMPNVNDEGGGIIELMSKETQKNLAVEAGLPVLNSCVIRTHRGEFEIPETVTYPCFMKPNISRNSSKGRMRKCNSKEELASYLTEFSKKRDIEMLIEDYVEIGKEYSLLGLSTRNGVIGPGFFVAEEGGQEEHRGVAVTGRLLPCSQYSELIDKLIKLIETLNFDGLYDVDLIETTDGKMYFVEVNMRFGASGYAVTKGGVNLPGMFADYMIFDKPIDLNCSISNEGNTFVSEKVLIEEYIKGRLKMSSIKKHMSEADVHFVKNKEDKQAYRHFRKFYLIAAIMRIAYKIKEYTEIKSGDKESM